jgi:hypothetical protein
MWHVACMQGNWGDSRLLMVESQIGNLTPDTSFGHNLCFKCPNGSCQPILNIYVPKDFQWYKKFFDPMNCDPYNYFLKSRKSIGLQLPKWELTWECGGSFLHILPHSREHDMWLPGFNLGPHLRKPLPKARVVTLIKAKYKKIDIKLKFQNLTKAKYKNIYLSLEFQI